MWAKIKTWFYKLIGRKSKVDEVFGLEVFDEKGDKTLGVTTETTMFKNFGEVPVYISAFNSTFTANLSHLGVGRKILLTKRLVVEAGGVEEYISGDTLYVISGGLRYYYERYNVGVLA